ncbi:MAG: hypothetical protein ACJ790_16420 [Myxococcaceae bacterium]
METNYYLVTQYSTYLLLSFVTTVWVARTLSRNGAVFLVDAFLGKERLADSVNHLLVVGFYLINLGWVILSLKTSEIPLTVQAVIEGVASKLGVVLVVLGAMHFLNLYIFSRMRRRALIDRDPPPVRSDEFVGRPMKVAQGA